MVGWARERRWWPALLSIAALGLAFGTLALTQSRSGWLGGAAGLLALAMLASLAAHQRRQQILAVALPLALILALGAFFALRPDVVTRVFDAAGGATGAIWFSGRPEISSRAIYAIQDFPFTGTGLGTFRRVVNLLYPLFTISPDTDIAHAHNMFLQVAVDVGLPGLIAYLALLELAAVVAWGAARRSSGVVRNLGLGLFRGIDRVARLWPDRCDRTGVQTGPRVLDGAWVARRSATRHRGCREPAGAHKGPRTRRGCPIAYLVLILSSENLQPSDGCPAAAMLPQRCLPGSSQESPRNLHDSA